MSGLHKVNLPERITLIDLRSNERVPAKLVRLDRETAKAGIDGHWWNVEGVPVQRLQEEVDYHWTWKVLISKFQNNPYAKCVAAVLADGSIPGAMIYWVNGKSVLEEGKRSVLIDRLATAPSNREWLSDNPRYRGTGSGLLTFAVCQSYFLGFDGRVSLFAAGDERFFVKRGFVRTKTVHEEMSLFEIPGAIALEHLAKKGLLS